jgi:hypothetical protein
LSKRANGIMTPNFLMTDQQIRQAIRWIGLCLCEPSDSEPICNLPALEISGIQ